MELFWLLLLLTTALDVKHLLLSSEEKGSFCEKESGEEILQKVKEKEAKIQVLYSHIKKEIAELEAKQNALARPELSLERTILHFIRKVLLSVAFMLCRLWE